MPNVTFRADKNTSCLSCLPAATANIVSNSSALKYGPGLRATAPTACNLFSDALPLLSAGVGGFQVALVKHTQVVTRETLEPPRHAVAVTSAPEDSLEGK